ncbi:hypothetical protein D3C85_1130220 [compost metagenome]
MARNEGNRTANSDSPRILIPRAWLQNDRGGFPQKGTPGSNQGVIQSPVSTIRRAISAYLGSEGSISGTAAIENSRAMTTPVNPQKNQLAFNCIFFSDWGLERVGLSGVIEHVAYYEDWTLFAFQVPLAYVFAQ